MTKNIQILPKKVSSNFPDQQKIHYPENRLAFKIYIVQRSFSHSIDIRN